MSKEKLPRTWNTSVAYSAVFEQEVIADTPEKAVEIALLSVMNHSYTRDVEVQRCSVAPFPQRP